jgi:MarR family transcriptional regulator, negative regulator of the multidrug operon emrRAB
MSIDRIRYVEDGIRRIAQRVPELPVAESVICRAIVVLGREICVRMDKVSQPYGLNDLDFRTLLLLFSRPDRSANPTELCGVLAQSPANMTRVGDGLAAKNLVTRILSDQDRRRMVVQITAQGERLVRELLPQMFGYTRDLFKDFSVKDKARLLADLKRLLGGLAASMDQPDTGESP